MNDKIRDAVQHLVVDALTAADLVRSGHRSKALSDRLSQHCSVLSKMIAAVPAAPVAQEPMAFAVVAGGKVRNMSVYRELSETFAKAWNSGWMDDIAEVVPLYAATPAADQPDAVKVPRELRALLGKEGE